MLSAYGRTHNVEAYKVIIFNCDLQLLFIDSVLYVPLIVAISTSSLASAIGCECLGDNSALAASRARSTTMPHYRIYTLTADNHIDGVETVECSSDNEALDQAT